MRFSPHYLHYYNNGDRKITLDQAESVVNDPVRVELQANGRTRYWGYVAAIGYYVRVVVEPDGEEIVTAFPDSNFRP